MNKEGQEIDEVSQIEVLPNNFLERFSDAVETESAQEDLETEEIARQKELPEVLDVAKNLAEPTSVLIKPEIKEYWLFSKSYG